MRPLPAIDYCRRFFLLWPVIALCTAPAAAQTSTFDIPQLMKILARVETREATFTEKKTLALLDEPLVSSGTLHYRRPDYIERITIKPRPEHFIYENGRITIESNGRQRQFQAKNQPLLWALIESVRATLAGDEEMLRHHYRLRLAGTHANWNLEMTPTEPDLAIRIRLIQISGARDQLQRIEILEASDDQTLMTISAIKR